MDKLDNPINGAPVYWLGRSYDAGPEFGTLTLEEVDDRGWSLALFYGTGAEGGRLVVEVWDETGWQEFFAMLEEARHDAGGNFVFAAPCLDIEEMEVNGYPARLLMGHEVQPAAGSLTTPTPTRAPSEACPPHDAYMLEVYIDGTVVTLNAPLSLWSLGWAYEAFDSPEALVAIAEGLHLRQPGE